MTVWKPRIRFKRGCWVTDWFDYQTWLKLTPIEKRYLDLARTHVKKLNAQRSLTRKKRQRKENK